jgi:hypothetical protein
MSDESNLLQLEASATPHGPYFAEDLEPDFGLRAGVDKEEGGVCLDELLGALPCQSGADVPDQGKRSIYLGRMVLAVTRFLRSPKAAAGGGAPNSAWGSERLPCQDLLRLMVEMLASLRRVSSYCPCTSRRAGIPM